MTRGPIIFGSDAPHRGERHEIYKSQGAQIPVIIRRPDNAPLDPEAKLYREANGLIDTGASIVVIDIGIARDLKLKQIDFERVGIVGDKIDAAVFGGVVEVPALGFKKRMRLYAPSGRLWNPSVLLGRSFLADFTVSFVGQEGCFYFYNTHEEYPGPVEDE
jgi:hypothetical protein